MHGCQQIACLAFPRDRLGGRAKLSGGWLFSWEGYSYLNNLATRSFSAIDLEMMMGYLRLSIGLDSDVLADKDGRIIVGRLIRSEGRLPTTMASCPGIGHSSIIYKAQQQNRIPDKR